MNTSMWLILYRLISYFNIFSIYNRFKDITGPSLME